MEEQQEHAQEENKMERVPLWIRTILGSMFLFGLPIGWLVHSFDAGMLVMVFGGMCMYAIATS